VTESEEQQSHRKPLGTINGFDLTVVGWTVEPLDMGDYADYVMKSPETGEWTAGICHARGVNADLPPPWLVYITVPDLEASLAQCLALGGTQLTPIKGDHGSENSYATIQDPAGAVLTLMQGPKPTA